MREHAWMIRTALILAMVAAAFVFGNNNAWAQGATPAPFNKVTVSEDVAKRTLMKAVINADTARAIVDACVEWQKAQPGSQSIVISVLSPTGDIIDSHAMDGVLPIGAETGLMKAKTALYARSSSASVARRFNTVDGRSIVIFVLSPTGDIIDSHAMDGVLPIGAETGLMKAKTALYARSSSASVAQRFNTVDGRLIRLDLGKSEGLSYYFVPGGLPIIVDNQLIGAVGVGGGNADEQCAYQALQKVLGPQPPLAPAMPPAAAPAPQR